MLAINSEEISVKRWPFILVVVVYQLVFLFALDLKSIDDSIKWVMAGSLIFISVLFYIVSKNKIIIDNTGITQQLLIGKQKELLWQNVKSSTISWDINYHGADLSWEFIDTYGKRLSINPSYFTRRSLKIIACAVLSKCPDAALDKRILKLAEGRFPWYIF